MFVASGQCQPTQYQCDSGQCISVTFVCDRDHDCPDASDERNCHTGQYERQRTARLQKCRRNIAETFNGLSRVHERYRQTDD